MRILESMKNQSYEEWKTIMHEWQTWANNLNNKGIDNFNKNATIEEERGDEK